MTFRKTKLQELGFWTLVSLHHCSTLRFLEFNDDIGNHSRTLATATFSSKKQTNEQVVAQEIDEAITLTDELTAKDKAEAKAELSEVKNSMADLNNRPEIEEIVENAKNPLQHRDEDLMLENMNQDIKEEELLKGHYSKTKCLLNHQRLCCLNKTWPLFFSRLKSF